MARQAGYVDTTYLDISKQRLRDDKRRSHELLGLTPGASVLEVGCGPASDTLDLAERVGPGGRVVGVDIDPDMIAEADQRAREANLLDRVTHQRANAQSLPFPDGAFDAVRAERVLQHVPDASAALAEMARVMKSRGRVVVMDTDWGSISIDTPETGVERSLTRYKSDHAVHGYIGRELFRMLRSCGLLEIEVDPRPTPVYDLSLLRLACQLDDTESEAIAAGVVTSSDVERWRAGLDAAQARGEFYSTVLITIVAGTKP